jgi:hypothetical protein
MSRIANAASKPSSQKIEITPAMIAAGTLAFSEYDCRFERAEDAVEKIYLAMEQARLSPSALPQPQASLPSQRE